MYHVQLLYRKSGLKCRGTTFSNFAVPLFATGLMFLVLQVVQRCGAVTKICHTRVERIWNSTSN